VAGAQAADLPVKAKAVEYVKICSLYGAGFYYMPGTNLCLKVGGYVRNQHYIWGGSSGTNNQMTGTAVFDTRASGSQEYIMRSRAILTLDARHQSEYGTVRAYLLIGHTIDTATTGSAAALYATRAFIQFAGFTLGRASSYYDFYANAAVSYFAYPGSDTGDSGWLVAAYTAQLGNGVSATLSIEEPRRSAVARVVGNAADLWTPGLLPTNRYANVQAPDIVGNIRIDQAWGAAQLMGAAHQVRATYYGATELTGYPSDEWGWAVGAGLRLKTDFITPGSYFQTQINYTEGALKYLAVTQNSNSWALFSGFGANTVGIGWVTDSVFGAAPTPQQLTKGWSINASYEHVWVPGKWRTSLYGGYMEIDYNNAANALVCATNQTTAGSVNNLTGVFTAGATATYSAGCNADFSVWWIGSRTQYNFTSYFYMGLDLLYTKLNTMHENGTVTYSAAPGSGKPAGTYLLNDQDNFAGTVRFHYDFLP
jgi:hypothetical protein